MDGPEPHAGRESAAPTPPLPAAPRRRWPLYFGVGLALTMISLVLEERVLALHPGPLRPGWVEALRLFVLAFPWLVAALLLCVRARGHRRTHWWAYSCGAALPWVLLLGLLFGPSLAEYAGRRDFDSKAWKAAASIPNERAPTKVRLKMIDDLIASGRLDNQHRSAVVELLGPDDSANGTGHGAGYFSGWDAVYWLGPQRGPFRIDSEWLVIRYGPDGRVREYRVVTD